MAVQNLLKQTLLFQVVVALTEILQLLKASQIHLVQQLVHHVLQLMLVGIHIHIKLAKQEKLLAHSYMLHVESQVRSNTVPECRPVRASWLLTRIPKHRSLKSQILA